MAKKRILCDKTELVLTITDRKRISIANLSYEQIVSIRFEPYTEFRFFRRVPSERIVISTSKLELPITYTRYREKEYFDEYKKELRKFAQDNRITFYDNLV